MSDSPVETPSNQSDPSRDIVILGAGICGLMTAKALEQIGDRVTVIDKARGVGGRLATRRIGPGRADHGAQFFTVRTPTFADYVEEWRLNGWVFEWATQWSDGSLLIDKPIGHVRFAAQAGMNNLAKQLAHEVAQANVAFSLARQVHHVQSIEDRWRLTFHDGSTQDANYLIATPPVPQTLALLDAGNVVIDARAHGDLQRIAYAPCLCLLMWVEGDVTLPPPGALQTPGEPITWIADNQRKGISPEAQILTVHVSPELSAELYNLSDSDVVERVLAEVPRLLQDVIVHETQVKRWRYALPTVTHPSRMLYLDAPAPLYFGGDGFGAPRVEGAALSGLAIGAALLRQLGHDQHRAVGITQNG